MSMPTDGRCINCGNTLSPEGWYVLLVAYDNNTTTVNNMCGIKCCTSHTRSVAYGRAGTRIIRVNETTYNPSEFLRVSEFELVVE